MENLLSFEFELNPVLTGSVVLVILLVTIFFTGYVKAAPNMAYIISGFKRDPRILIGRAGIKIPFLERKDELIIKQISVDIKTNGCIPTSDFIGVDVDAVAKVRVKTDEDGIQLAMKNFLNMDEHQIMNALTDSLQGNMREIIGTITLKDITNDRKKFGDEVQEKAQKDMNALGIEIISCNIQRVEDEQGLINDLGKENMAQIKKDASIAQARADRDVAIERANAAKAANEAQVASETEIAIKQNELQIKKAELKKAQDIKQAEADAAYQIQEQEQRKSIEIASANADIAKQEREIELKEKEAQVKEQELSATIKKQADAEKYRILQQSDADLYKRQKEAEAKLFEQAREADAKKVEAEAHRYAKEQEAAGIAAVGKAEAEAIKAKGIAESEAMDKKAEAMKKYGKAAMTEMLVNVLPQIAEAVAQPLSQIDRISIIGGSDDTSIGGVANNVPIVMAKTIESVKEATGFDLREVMKADTFDAKVNKNISFNKTEE